MPRVSVVIPTFNCATYLPLAIDSVLSQSYKDLEILVVDDGSTDGTAERISHHMKRIRYVYQENEGASAARNRAVEMSTGEYIAYLDADDMWYPQKLELQVAYLDRDMECGLVHSDVCVIDERDEILHRQFNSETARSVPQGSCLLQLLHHSHIQTLTVVERRDCFEKVGGFDKRLPIAQDYMHWILIALEGWKIGYIGEPLAKYRWRRGSLMASKRRLLEDYERIYSILLNETSLGDRYGKHAIDTIEERITSVQRELAGVDYAEGRNATARRRLARLIQRSPLSPKLYLDLLKACLHPSLHAKLRAFRGMSTRAIC